jgi:hypothetical protein
MNFSNISIMNLNRSVQIPESLNIKELVCFQLNSQLIKTGFIIVIAYILYTWLGNYFFMHGYKRFKYDKDSAIGRFIGDLDSLQTRIYWDSFIKDKFAKVMIGFIVMILYFLLA